MSAAWSAPGSWHRLRAHALLAAQKSVLQDSIEESGEEFLDLLASDDCLFYFCGLKRMYTSVMEVRSVDRGCV